MRKAQITLWVILGIVLLLLVSLLFMLFRSPDLRSLENLPGDFQPVQQHLLDCVETVAIAGLKEMGSHGGYIAPRDPTWTGEELGVDLFSPTEGELLLANKGDIESGVPYYLYLKGENRCEFCTISSLTPSIEEMESQLERYILEHLPQCVNYGLFPDISVTPGLDEEIAVTINEENLLIEYERQLSLSSRTQTVTARNFPVLLELPYGRYYAMAKAITQKEIDTQFLENYLLYLISAYSGRDADLPPFADYEESFSPSFWVLLPVQQRLQEILFSTTPLLQVLETKDVGPPPRFDDPYMQGFFEMLYLDLLDDPRSEELSIHISYLNDPLYVEISPREGQLLKPHTERIPSILLFPARQQNYYNFLYDVSVPFLVEIRHEGAMETTDFSFLFALEANIRDNKNLIEWLSGRGTLPWSNQLITYDLEEPAQPPEMSVPADAPLHVHNQSIPHFFCSQRVMPFQMKVFDGSTVPSVPLQDVDFAFSCGHYASCPVGHSVHDGSYARLETSLPVCIGGLLKAEKEGYHTKMARLSTQFETSLPDMLLYPYKDVPVSFVKHRFGEENGVERYLGTEELDEDDTVMVTLRLLNSDDEAPHVTSAFFDKGVAEIGTVSLVPGHYEVTVQYLDNEGFFIPATAECDITVDDDLNVTPAPLGGLELSGETRYFHVERSLLYGAESLTIPFFVAPTPRCVDQLDRLGDVRQYTRQNLDKAFPQFV
jgi:hypothetical protein